MVAVARGVAGRVAGYYIAECISFGGIPVSSSVMYLISRVHMMIPCYSLASFQSHTIDTRELDQMSIGFSLIYLAQPGAKNGGRTMHMSAVPSFSIMVIISLIPCIVAKFFCLFECFFSLRKLPADTYDNVQWSSYLPHL